MSSIALACTQEPASAKAVVETMLTALEDRAPSWTTSATGIGVVGSGAHDAASAQQQLLTVPGGDVTVAIDAPEWLRREFELTLADKFASVPVVSPEVLIDLFATMTGDVHCVAVLGSGDCVAYRGPTSSRPLF